MARYLSPRRRRLARLRRLTGALVVLAVALSITVVALIAAIDRNLLRDRIAARLSSTLDRQVRLAGDVDLRPGLRPVIVLHDVGLANIDGGSRPEMARVGTVELEVALWPLLRGEPAVRRVALRDGEILLERRADGTPNWRLGGEGEGDEDGGTTGLNALRVRDVDVVYVAADGRERRVTLDEASLAAASPTAPARLAVDGTVEGLALGIEGLPGSVDAVLGARTGAQVDLEVRLGDARMSLAGVADRPLAPAAFQLTVDFEAPSLAPVEAVTGADLPGWAPVAVGASASLDRAALRLADLTATVGPTALAGNLAIDFRGKRPAISGALGSDMLDLAALLAGGGMSNDGDGGTGFLPAIPIDLGLLARFDADLRLRAERVPIGAAALERAAARLRVADGDGRLHLDRATLAGGTVGGLLTAGAAETPPALGVELTMAGLDAGALLTAYGLTDRLTGNLDAELRLDGAGADLQALAGDLAGDLVLTLGPARYDVTTPGPFATGLLDVMLPSFDGTAVTLHCAVLRTPVRGGVAGAGRLLVALPEMTVAGSGSLDLTRLTMELLVEAEVQEMSGASLLPPILVRGPLLGPSIEAGPSGGSMAIPPVAADAGAGNACAAALDRAMR